MTLPCAEHGITKGKRAMNPKVKYPVTRFIINHCDGSETNLSISMALLIHHNELRLETEKDLASKYQELDEIKERLNALNEEIKQLHIKHDDTVDRMRFLCKSMTKSGSSELCFDLDSGLRKTST